MAASKARAASAKFARRNWISPERQRRESSAPDGQGGAHQAFRLIGLAGIEKLAGAGGA